MPSREKPIMHAIMLAHGHGDVRLFRNNVGEAWAGQGTMRGDGSVLIRHPWRVKHGLANGSSDTVGWRSVTITPEMVGRKVAVFVAIEVKDQGRVTEGQSAFISQVQEAGGLAGVARSVEDAGKILGEKA